MWTILEGVEGIEVSLGVRIAPMGMRVKDTRILLSNAGLEVKRKHVKHLYAIETVWVYL
jgi:hypothetical protein